MTDPELHRADRGKRRSLSQRVGKEGEAFVFDGNGIMGIEQNPKTKSRWAATARAGKKVMQFI
jgi:hypothetical protein